jgi:hypothetical protein
VCHEPVLLRIKKQGKDRWSYEGRHDEPGLLQIGRIEDTLSFKAAAARFVRFGDFGACPNNPSVKYNSTKRKICQ